MFKKITLLASLCVTMFSFAQTVSTVTDGNFYDSIDRDSQGNIYCSDFFNGTVYKYSFDGNVSVFASGLVNPNGISVNGQDEIFICDAGADIIYRYDTNGNELSAYTSNIDNPTGIRNVPGTTEMLFVEYDNNVLKQLDLDGTVSVLFTGSPLNGPSGIAFINGETFVSNYNNRMIMKFENGAMNMITQLPAGGPNSNFLGFLSSSESRLYATQLGEHQIYVVNPNSGVATVYAGSSLGNMDGDISTATFNFPNGIFADSATNTLYISDAGTSNLRIISDAALSTEENELSRVDLKIITNSVSDSLSIQANLKSNDQVTIKIYEISGKEVFSKEYSVEQLDFSVNIGKESFRSGAYILLFDQSNRLVSKKIIIE